jgi:hypothetical protein
MFIVIFFAIMLKEIIMCDSPFWVMPKKLSPNDPDKVPVPCGRCPPCKLRRVNSWVFRLLQEQKVSTMAHFVTLTYDTRFVPISDNGFMTLRKRDLQLYWKRLRKLCPGAILKYYAVGEYGTNNRRPHYHAIVFNVLDINAFHQAWGLGQIHVGQVTTDSIAYTMKYIDKPVSGQMHGRDDREREFPLMSKALGASYLSDDIIQYHQADVSRLYATKEGGHRIALPRYYRQKIYSDDQMRIQRHLAGAVTEKLDDLDRREFDRLYSDAPDYTYEMWKESHRFGRYQSFYSNQKDRDI